MKIELSYGKTGLIVELPDTLDAEVTVIEPKFVPGVEDEAAALLESLRKPIGCEPLAEMAAKLGPEQKVAVVVCDATRPVPNWRILPVVLGAGEGGRDAGADRHRERVGDAPAVSTGGARGDAGRRGGGQLPHRAA